MLEKSSGGFSSIYHFNIGAKEIYNYLKDKIMIYHNYSDIS